MKFLHLTAQFQYAEALEELLAEHGVQDLVRYPQVAGWDSDGRHDGSQAFPGYVTVIQAQVPADQLDALLERLRAFREEKPAHGHLQALVLPIEVRL
jgi:hypothetical protein